MQSGEARVLGSNARLSWRIQVNLEAVDQTKFPRFGSKVSAVEAVLGPGDILVLPAGELPQLTEYSEGMIILMCSCA